jgi:hypothetical protein
VFSRSQKYLHDALALREEMDYKISGRREWWNTRSAASLKTGVRSMSQSYPQPSTIIPLRPVTGRKAKAKQAKARQPRKRNVAKAVQSAIELRDHCRAVAQERRELDAHALLVRREEKWGGLRSLALLSLISATLVGALLAGISG